MNRVIQRLQTIERPRFSHRFQLIEYADRHQYPSAMAAATALKVAISYEAEAQDGVDYASYRIEGDGDQWCALATTARGFIKYVAPSHMVRP